MAAVSHGAKLYPVFALLLGGAVSCTGPASAEIEPTDPAATTVPVYDSSTGRLERLESDRDGDGQVDATAYMDGTRLEYVEIDRDRDGAPDRWEYYVPNPTGEPGPGSPDGRNLIDRALERAGPDAPVSRREFFVGGLLTRAEEDRDLDGRIDKWEYFAHGALQRLELDLQGRGFPDRRLVYERGTLLRIEADPDGDGTFSPIRQIPTP